MESLNTNYESFLKTSDEILKKNPFFIAIFKGSLDPQTGKNWCPDCVAAEEPIKKFLYPAAQLKNIEIIEVKVGKREE